MSIDYKAIGKRIRKTRLEKGISQSFLSEQINVSDGYISKIETGKAMISLATLVNIANILETSVDAILSDNIIQSINIHNKEAKEILDDLNHNEFRLMLDIMRFNKEVIRSSEKLALKNIKSKK